MKIFLLFLFCTSSLSLYAGIKVAVTIDDLPTAGDLPPQITWKEVARKMLVALKKHKVPESYAFINADKVTPENGAFEVLKLWQEAGYSFGNHTFRHEDLNKISIDEFKTAIDRNESMLNALSGELNWKYFRYPFLHEGNSAEKRNEIRTYLKSKNYTIAQVTIDFEDYSWNNPYARCMKKSDVKAIEWLKKTYLQNASDILDRSEQLTKKLFKKDVSHILLLHIGGLDAEMLDQLLSTYEQKGVEFIPLSEAVRDEIYQIDPAVIGEWGSEFPYQVLKSRKLTLKDVGMAPYQGYPEKELETVCF